MPKCKMWGVGNENICSCEGGGDRQITRGAETKKVTDFILDIVDSIDVQVAWMNDAEEMVRRAGYYYNDWFLLLHSRR